MNILCNWSPCGPSYVRNGWRKVFEYLGHRFVFWNKEQQPAFDVFSEVNPDIYIGCTYEVDRAVYKNIQNRPNMKVALFGSAWSPYVADVDVQKYPIVIASDVEKQTIEKLKKETGKPDFVFVHVTDRFLSHTMSGWKEIGVTPIGILNAADIFTYYKGNYKPELQCDIGFVGGFWGYKSKNLYTHMIPLCNDSGVSVKIFGNQNWPVVQFLGSCSDSDARDLFVSATVCPNVSEPHSTDLGWDVIERPFKIFSSGGFCVSDYVEEANEIFSPNELVMRKTSSDFTQTIKYFVESPASRNNYMERSRRKVLTEHTYFQRVEKMLRAFTMTQEADRCSLMHRDFVGGEL
jgi:hypothetical protein